MKKRLFSFSVIVFALAVYSCTKESVVGNDNLTGTPIIVSIENPVISEEGEEPDSKVSFVGVQANGRYRYNWDTTDKFYVYSYSWSKSLVAYWGPFSYHSASSTDNAANFKGMIPDGFSTTTHGDTLIAIHSAYTTFNKNTLVRSGTKGRYDFKFNIPDVQDGTGFKYCLITSKQLGTSGVLGWDATNNNFTGKQFAIYCGLCRVLVPVSGIKTLKITMSYGVSDANQYLVSDGSKADLNYNCNGSALSGGGSRTLTIYNNNQDLGEVFFACRQTQTNNTYGCCTLTFECTHSNGKTVTKRKVLAKDITYENGVAKTANTYYGISQYSRLTNLGTIPITAADFE